MTIVIYGRDSNSDAHAGLFSTCEKCKDTCFLLHSYSPTDCPLPSQNCDICPTVVKIDEEISQAQRLLFDLAKRRQDATRKNNSLHDRMFGRLPVEVVSHIFRFAVEPHIATSPRKHKWVSDALPLGSVCKGWRDITLGTPHLWTTISINLRKESFHLHYRMVDLYDHESWAQGLTAATRLELGIDGSALDALRKTESFFDAFGISHPPNECILPKLQDLQVITRCMTTHSWKFLADTLLYSYPEDKDTQEALDSATVTKDSKFPADSPASRPSTLAGRQHVRPLLQVVGIKLTNEVDDDQAPDMGLDTIIKFISIEKSGINLKFFNTNDGLNLLHSATQFYLGHNEDTTESTTSGGSDDSDNNNDASGGSGHSDASEGDDYNDEQGL